MLREYFVIDAFTGTPFNGNPAAVVLDAEGLTDEQMQAIAAEFNLSETTFILPAEQHQSGEGACQAFRFRWFTPAAEVTMCGHATVAGLHALAELGRIPEPTESAGPTTVRIETLGGVLTGFIERTSGPDGGRTIWLELVKPKLATFSSSLDTLASAVGAAPNVFDAAFPPVTTQDADLIAFVTDFTALNSIRPDLPRLASWLAEHGARGLCLATIHTVTPSVHVQSRFFAPGVGIDEDPVTGSVHGPLVAYLAKRGHGPVREGTTTLTCRQGKPGGRTGQIQALVGRHGDGDSWVRIGGQAVVTMRGQLI